MSHGRLLSSGERALARFAFGEALALEAVRLHQAKWWMWQPAWVTMAPDGHIWFHPNGRNWHADFADAPIGAQRHFIHEMVHVWQHQQGLDLRLKRLPFARYRYLPLLPGRPFHRYGIEQQAEIVADAFTLARGYGLKGRAPLADYAALIPFWPAADTPAPAATG